MNAWGNHRMGTAIGFVTRAARDLLDLCYPRTCAVCEQPSEHLHFCTTCDQALTKLQEQPFCDRCAAPLATTGAPCPFCSGKGFRRIDRVARLGNYEDPLRSLIHNMKYGGRWPIAEVVAERLLEVETAKALLQETQLLVPVPLHRLRQIARGYNQADVVARQLQQLCGIRVAHPATRVLNTHTQTHLHSRAQREDNLKHAFALLDSAAVRGKDVTIVDDVLTTGATVTSLARAIAKGKPASINVLVLAVADPKGRGFESA